MAENAADNSTDDCAGYVGAAAIFGDLLTFDPATLLGWANYGADRRYRNLVEPFVGSLPIFIGR
jgi:hypothetical protein